MPGQIVLVHNRAAFGNEAASALREAGYAVAAFTDPMRALDALDGGETTELLITRVNYPKGKPNGVALALMARNRCPDMRVLFTARADMQRHAEGIGEFLPTPVAVSELVAVVTRLLPRSAVPLRFPPVLTLRHPTLQRPLSVASDELREFSWSTRQLLRLAATTVARSQRLHDHAAQLRSDAAHRIELARNLRVEWPPELDGSSMTLDQQETTAAN